LATAEFQQLETMVFVFPQIYTPRPLLLAKGRAAPDYLLKKKRSGYARLESIRLYTSPERLLVDTEVWNVQERLSRRDDRDRYP